MNSREWKNQHLKLGELLMLAPYDSLNKTPTPSESLTLPANPQPEQEARACVEHKALWQGEVFS